MRRASVLLLTLSLTSCITPEVTRMPPSDTDFGQYKTVSYKVHTTPSTEFGSGQEALEYGRSTITLFDALLGPRLKSMGHTISDESPDLIIDIAVKAVKPGSAAARFWVGFGAGRAVLLFDATFTDRNGKALGSFQGGRAHTGLEFGQSFASIDEIQSYAATGAVQQIAQFMRNDGTFGKKTRRTD